ncbi:MAG: hypothetical protein ACFB0B_15455 [Thermonemataceae bacterium]
MQEDREEKEATDEEIRSLVITIVTLWVIVPLRSLLFFCLRYCTTSGYWRWWGCS